MVLNTKAPNLGSVNVPRHVIISRGNNFYLQNMFCNKSKFVFNIWLMGWGQEEFAGGLQNQAKDTVTLSYPDKVTATKVTPESSFSQ